MYRWVGLQSVIGFYLCIYTSNTGTLQLLLRLNFLNLKNCLEEVALNDKTAFAHTKIPSFPSNYVDVCEQ